MVSREVQGLQEIPYNTSSREVGSLVGSQPGLIDMLLDGSWRTFRQQKGTSGGTDSATPDETIKTTATGASNTVGKIPTWALVLLGLVVAAVVLKGK